MSAPVRLRRAYGERGSTLLELTVVAAILALAGAGAFASLGQRPAHAYAAAVTFSALVREARSLAAVTAGENATEGSGATIGVVRDGDSYIATLYAYRPIRGAAHQPRLAAHTPPLRVTAPVELTASGAAAAPPFGLFFAASGRVSAQAGYAVDVTPPAAAEPACPAASGVRLTFGDAPATQTLVIDCASALTRIDRTQTL